MDLTHKYFIQYMMKHGSVPLNTALNYCTHASQGGISDLIRLKTIIVQINREISKQFFKIVIITCEVTDQEVVVWLSTKNDDISKLQTSFNELELEYFHAILQEIVNSDLHRLTFIVVINITSTLTANFSRDSGQKVLNKWLKIGYFARKGEFICLGPRTLLEFAGYLKRHLPNSVCNLCSELVFLARVCNSCDTLFHSHCVTKFLLNHDICPSCKNKWNEDVFLSQILDVPMNNGTDDSEDDSPVHNISNDRHTSTFRDDEQEAGPSRSKISRKL